MDQSNEKLELSYVVGGHYEHCYRCHSAESLPKFLGIGGLSMLY